MKRRLKFEKKRDLVFAFFKVKYAVICFIICKNQIKAEAVRTINCCVQAISATADFIKYTSLADL